jgi:hypothetical protein
MAKIPKHLQGMFEEGEEGECPPLTASMVRAAETKLGYRLPATYVELMKVCNGGSLKRNVFPIKKCPRWATDHVAFEQVMGIGGDWGIDGEAGSAYLIAEWEYPGVGVVISSDGHTAFMLDYSKCGPEGEPRVIWVDTETGTGKPDVVVLAPDFGTFLAKLREPPEDDK